ncbi:type II toxin-antitoxin system Phd/YefM family antitoxin [Sphingomonas nostoxanthinifaciens]|uniref:type II toxin-antitoxin system Phd/YefM family antitoxin n=1 Tax=Sphingomonas nostoxanthinifaciens TaxID=2872652 RepID=UPI001CC1E01A|nr:type II toxin-antitoxin system Phd/YefM family antitoxin [Sphingomonas nostoxanthinifaciens]UAK25227.1 type II toxin-antitoxin system Phd/YefM family antitoxin [Sphingomonas nostoxanthinifaciens]
MRLISSREFNQDVSRAKRAARIEPVFVTDRGRPTHVLLSIDAFRRLSGDTESVVELLAASANFEVEARPADATWARGGTLD